MAKSVENLLILTDEQLVQMAQEGSKTAEEILIEKYKSLVKLKAKPYFIVGADNEDLVQEGMIGIFKAVHAYDPSKDSLFKTFADKCVNTHILNAIKKANRQKNQPLNESISLSKSAMDDETLTIGDLLVASIDDEPENIVVLSDILSHIKDDEEGMFSPLEKQVLEEKLKGLNYQEIAKALGKPAKSIDNALQRIKKKITAYFEK